MTGSEKPKIKKPKGLPKVGACRMCGEFGTLVQSHIIPKAFFEPDSSTRMLSNSKGVHPKSSPVGIYDRIVCAACERRFDPYDNYAAKILLQSEVAFQPVKAGPKLVARVAQDVDYTLLKLFSISVIWRASVCSQSFYNRVDLGPFEKRARAMILANDPGEFEDFATWWSVFDLTWTPGIMDPFFERWNGTNAYRLYLGKVLAYTKVDQRSIPAVFREIALAPGRPLVLIGRNFEGSSDAKAMVHMLRTAEGGI